MGDVDVTDFISDEVFDVFYSFGIFFDVGELFLFVVDVTVTEGDCSHSGFEEVALFVFEKNGVVDTTDFEAVRVASKSSDEE